MARAKPATVMTEGITEFGLDGGRDRCYWGSWLSSGYIAATSSLGSSWGKQSSCHRHWLQR